MLELIIGRSGTGKTERCLQIIQELTAKKIGTVLILPEHMTHKMEQVLAEKLQGFFDVEVCGFKKLAEKILSEVAGEPLPRLNELGKNLILRKILTELNKDELLYFHRAANQRGFATKLSAMLKELHSYKITPTVLKSTADNIGNSVLSDKLIDLALLDEKFQTSIENKSTTRENLLDEVAQKISKSDFIRNRVIFIDGFIFFNPQEKNVLRQIFQTDSTVYLTLPMNIEQHYTRENHSASGIFNRSYTTFQMLLKMCHELNIEIKITRLEKNHRSLQKDLIMLEKYLYSRQFDKTNSDGSLQIYEAKNRREEIEAVAGDILRLCREKNYRYKDIGVVLRDDTYRRIIPYIFDELHIPFFHDTKRSATNHALCRLIKSALELLHSNRIDPLFAMLRTGFFAFADDEIDALENLALKQGIRKFQELNLNFTASFEKLATDLRKKTMLDKITAIYNFLDDINVQSTLNRWMDYEENQGNLEKSNEHRLIWNGIIDLFDQMAMLDLQKITQKEFETILTEGLESLEIRMIPQSIDEVTITSFDQNSLANIKALYVIGFDSENFPRKMSDRNLLTDSDRSKINELGIEINLGSNEQSLAENFLVYRTLTSARNYLWISYSIADTSGKGVTASSNLDRLQRIVRNIKSVDRKKIFLPLSESKLGLIYRQRIATNESAEFWNDVYNYNLEHDRKDLSGLFAKSADVRLTTDTAQKIYSSHGKLLGSVTRFESFSSCAFKHFAKYGLKLNPRDEFEFRGLDLGNVLHGILKQYGENVKSRGEMWKDQTDVESTVNEILNNITPKILTSTEQKKHQLNRIKKIAVKNISRLIEFDKQSQFHPQDYEIKFGENDSPLTYDIDQLTMQIAGQIDRLDTSSDHFFIIDYKTRDTKLDTTKIYWGLQLQLLTYLLAAKMMNKGELAGAIYCILKTPKIGNFDHQPTNDELQKNSQNMNGWLLSDESIINQIDSKKQFIKINVNQRGRTVRNAEEFSVLLKHVENLLIDIGEKIIHGEIQPVPYQLGNERACKYCDYKDICRFDTNIPGFEYRECKKMDINDFPR